LETQNLFNTRTLRGDLKKRARVRKWIKALRSGDYKQGRRTLKKVRKSTERWCCLGVALDLLDPQGWLGPALYAPNSTCHRLASGQGTARLGREAVSEFALSKHANSILTVTNDTPGSSFKKIANLLETAYKVALKS